jgi:uncharacterized membrane protein
MQICNPLQMNDWHIKSFFLLIFSIQIFFLVLVGLDSIKIHIPILRPLISFIILSFIPGVLILRILKIHEIGSVKTVLYSVGLSIGSLMLIGLFVNTIYPFFGVLRPISLFNLVVTINLFVLFLCVFCYLRDKNFSRPNFVLLGEILSPYFLFLCLIPFFSIFGTYLFNGYGNNTLQMIFLLIIAIFPLITLKWIPKKLYSFVIFVLSISILFHTTLVSSFVWGVDLNTELPVSNFVLNNALWYPSLGFDYNGMLSIGLLAPIYSIISNLSLTWVFKIIYPAIFSLVPVGLFVVYNKLTNHKIALLACIFFITVNAFFVTLPETARQEIAELFLALILMLVIDEKISRYSRSILLALFGFSLVVSHYGTSFIFLLIMGLAGLVVLILNRFPPNFRIENIGFENYKIINYSFFLFFLISALAWFIYVSNAIILQNLTLVGYNIFTSMTEVVNPSANQGYFVLSSSMPYLQSIERYLYLICELLIGIGILNLFFNNIKKSNTEYTALSIASFFVLVIGFILPYFAGAMNTDRLFNINLLLLSVFFVMGFIAVIKGINQFLIKFLRLRSFKISAKNSLYTIGIFLLIFSIFNTGFIYQVFDQPKVGRFALDKNQDFYMVNDQELGGMKWLKQNNNPKTIIYEDAYKTIVSNSLISMDKTFFNTNGHAEGALNEEEAQASTIYSKIFHYDSYVYFGTFNINNKVLLVPGNGTYDYYFIKEPDLENKILKIYDNGGSWILKGPGS